LPRTRVFDQPHYQLLNEARGQRVRELLADLSSNGEFRTAVDVGCGFGYFSGLLQSVGMDVLGVDGRVENATEAQRRLPGVRFATCNAEDPALRGFGKFDLVFCFGLLYHLENPMLAISHLKELTKRLLLVESVIFPGDEPIMALVNEGPTEDQGINYVAFYPTEACLIKILYRVGFSRVYRFTNPPDHPEYRPGAETRRTRTMLAGSNEPVITNQLEIVPEPSTSVKPWDPWSCAPERSVLTRVKSFTRRSFAEKVKAVKRIVRDE
jgi:SAM-dependent methyltransferase